MIWCILAGANAFDAKNYKIPNQLICLGYVLGIMSCIFSYGISGIRIFVLNAIWPIVLLYLLFSIGAIGAGDIKLFSVMSSMVGATVINKTILYSIFLAGGAAILLCIKEHEIIKRKLHFSYYISAGYFIVWLMEVLKI